MLTTQVLLASPSQRRGPRRSTTAWHTSTHPFFPAKPEGPQLRIPETWVGKERRRGESLASAGGWKPHALTKLIHPGRNTCFSGETVILANRNVYSQEEKFGKVSLPLRTGSASFLGDVCMAMFPLRPQPSAHAPLHACTKPRTQVH